MRAMPAVRLQLLWYDLWIGVYIDRASKRAYVCPLPCVVFSWNYGAA